MSTVSNQPDEIESFIRRAFEENFERLRLESGHSLAPDVKEMALQQVLMYWRRLQNVALSITDTEVRLNLPGQITEKGRKFAIEGVVDIVREVGRTIMYDLKTHDPETVQANLPDYQKQLNVYAHVWQHLRSQQLDETAIIATRFPESIKEALRAGGEARLAEALDAWNPVLSIPFEPEQVEDTVREFGKVVDAIEEGRFAPAPAGRLKKQEAAKKPFAVRICQNCDGRFTCASYREYARTSTGRDPARFREYYEDYGPEDEREERQDALLGGAA